MSDSNKTSVLAMFAFPVLGLIADALIIIYRGVPSVFWLLFAVLAFIIPVAFIPGSVKNEDDDAVYRYGALAGILPIILLAAATTL